MTCAGHDPGEDRPGVPYEMSRCCFFKLGNVLLDGRVGNGRNGSRLSRLKRFIECKKQIGTHTHSKHFVVCDVFYRSIILPISGNKLPWNTLGAAHLSDV